jgi:hypothetical protein
VFVAKFHAIHRVVAQVAPDFRTNFAAFIPLLTKLSRIDKHPPINQTVEVIALDQCLWRVINLFVAHTNKNAVQNFHHEK